MQHDLPIIQKTYNFIKWYVPLLDRLPTAYKFGLGERASVANSGKKIMR